ncbi:MAG: bifunctional hydroxymethylpyrimidine kinase/phosphomethylpyrimidine kinase [Anaerolineales bacterium]|nr:bifunctional hydroxymethylpyrimidine kinase/phosphomethylpyrimidine kinase [Anaerolineales bacterium]
MTLRTARMPHFGETLVGADFDMGPGGKGSNQAVATAKLGADAYFAGIIGDDKLGEIATDLYAREGVNTTYLKKTRTMATGVGFIILNEAGENGIILDMAANKLMDPAFVDTVEDQIARSAVVMTVLELPVPAAAHAMVLGRRHGVRTVLNPAPATRLDDSVLANVDYLTPNETELRILMGLAPNDPTPTVELARRLRQRFAGVLIVTEGEKGASVFAEDGEVQIPAARVDVVDTTGAGDAFNAALAVALAEGRALLDAVQFANCSGALACTHLGVIPALAERAAVDALWRKTYA